jgi:predicted nucleotidyltransferase
MKIELPGVVKDYVAARERERQHHVVYLTGAHAYGFPSPDSDWDVKCVHVAPTRELVGLVPHDRGADAIEVIDGVEIDYGSNEIGGVLRGVLKGNGNYLERLLGDCVITHDPRLESLRPLAKQTLSRLVFRHYAGFARSQLGAAEASAPPAAKKVLYVLRTTLTGAHLLRTGELVTDLNVLAEPYGFAHAAELIAQKKNGERVPLDDASWKRWRDEVERAFETLARERDASPLPTEPSDTATAALDAWLVALRRDCFDGER